MQSAATMLTTDFFFLQSYLLTIIMYFLLPHQMLGGSNIESPTS